MSEQYWPPKEARNTETAPIRVFVNPGSTRIGYEIYPDEVAALPSDAREDLAKLLETMAQHVRGVDTGLIDSVREPESLEDCRKALHDALAGHPANITVQQRSDLVEGTLKRVERLDKPSLPPGTRVLAGMRRYTAIIAPGDPIDWLPGKVLRKTYFDKFANSNHYEVELDTGDIVRVDDNMIKKEKV
jgi:hypothetical protein